MGPFRVYVRLLALMLPSNQSVGNRLRELKRKSGPEAAWAGTGPAVTEWSGILQTLHVFTGAFDQADVGESDIQSAFSN